MNNIVLASYFSKKKHPNEPGDTHVVGRNSQGFVDSNTYEYIKPWYDSLISNDQDGVLFHDNLSKDFVNKYQNDTIKFIKVEDSKWSNLDYRWMCYETFLNNNEFDNVFMTDCSDVTLVQPLHTLIDKHKDVSYFACNDSISLAQFSFYMNFHQSFNLPDRVWFLLNQQRLKLINMGVIGCNYKNALKFLKIYNEFRVSLASPEIGNLDMACGQYVFRRLLKDKKILIGEPFCSEFKKYQNDRKDVYFIHK